MHKKQDIDRTESKPNVSLLQEIVREDQVDLNIGLRFVKGLVIMSMFYLPVWVVILLVVL